MRRRNRAALNFASAGIGSGTHINAEKFELAAGIEAVHIPYKGTPEALNDTMTGRVTYFFSPISAALPQIPRRQARRAGRHSAKRSSVLPDVPTIAEGGLPGFDYNLWVGIVRPAGTSRRRRHKINGDVRRSPHCPMSASGLRVSAPSRCR